LHPSAWLMQQQALDLILIDLNIADASELFQKLTVSMPHIPLVALAEPQRIGELQNVMWAGAAGFVAFPLEPTQLIATLERTRQNTLPSVGQAPAQARVASQRHANTGSKQPGKVIVITSLKGGIGRSTIAVNLAIGLHQQTSRSVVLVEAHHGLGHLALLLNLYPRHTIQSIADEPNLDLDLVQGLLQNHSSGVRLLAAPADPTQLVELSVDLWRQVIGLLKEIADYVVVDTAAHADALLSEIVSLGDEILVVIGADIAGLRDGRILLQSLEHEAVVAGNIHLVLNRAGAQGGIDERIAQSQLSEPLAASLPEDVGLATFAFNRGTPFVLSHPRALLSRRLGALAERLAHDQVDALGQAPPPRPSLFALLSSLFSHKPEQTALAS